MAISSVKKIFKSRSPRVSYTFQCNNKKVIFVMGNYFTSIPEEIEELTKEIAAGNPMFYIDPNDSELDTEAETKRIAALKAEAVAEYIASQEKLKDGTTDMGTTTQEPLKPVGTDKLMGMLAQSTSGSSAPVATATTK